MTEYFLELLNISIPYISSFPIFVYPMWKEKSVRTKSVVIYFILFTLYICTILLVAKRILTIDFSSAQLLKLYITLPANIMPFVVFRKRVWQNIFLQAVAAMYASITNGVGMYAGANWFTESAHPMLVSNTVSLITIAVTLPPLLYYLKRLCENLAIQNAPVWRFIWLLPSMYFFLFLFAGNFSDRASFIGGGPILIRILIYAALIITCVILQSSLRQASENAALKENARIIESQIEQQGKQYAQLMENAEAVKAMRHDIRHHFTVLSGYNQSGDNERLGTYLTEIAGAMPTDDKMYCDNFAVNSVVAHYLNLAQNENITVDAKLVIPEKTGALPVVDLCVVMGNLLENALEGCRRGEGTNACIRVRSRVDGDALSIVIENNFDGICREEKGVYISRKESGGGNTTNLPREGVGLSSVRAIKAWWAF